MQILNALQVKKGAKVDSKGINSFTQPIQFLSREDKDEAWAQHNLDWLEWQGVKQIAVNARRLMKNYKLAKGTIDRSDYIPEENNDMNEVLSILSSDSIVDETEGSAIDLKFYPIIPNVINVLAAEFAKRNTKIDYRAIDEYSHNEILEAKMQEIGSALLEDAESKLRQKLISAGMDPNSPEFQKELDPNALKRLPEIEEYYSKTYQTLGEQWATKQHMVDTHRFHMDELEEIAFRDMLITDREFWHFKMMEDDYEVELWNPVLSFYHKSPNTRYVSQGSWAGKIDMATISDVIDMYGSILNQDQMESLESLHPVRAGRYLDGGIAKDGYYNPEVSHAENLNESLQMKRHLSFYDNEFTSNDVVSWILGETENTGLAHDSEMLRVTTAYWKTQRKIGYCTSILESGEVEITIVDESFVSTNNPVYNTKFSSKRNAETLVFGNHVEWIWINQTYGGVKIGPNRMMMMNSGNKSDEFMPIYIGINQNEIGPLRFQFKGENSVYGCKLPVEGKIFTERNSKSTALVDLMKPAQIGFNLVNNQIADILIDEIGTVIALDQNALPKHSLGEDWGKGNYAKAYVAMKDFSILPFDTSISNTENALAMQHMQTLDMSQTNRLMSRIQLANYFKQQAMDVIGITPQRLGQQIGQTDTATGIEQAVAGSYAQTEMYFIQHSDYLMPRVHQMRTDLAQYYHSKKPSIRMQSMVSADERKFFEINGVDLLLIDLNVFCASNANTRSITDQIKKIVATNNTAGNSIYEIGELMQAQSLGTLNNKMKSLDAKAQERAQQAAKAEEEAQIREIQAKEKEKQIANDHEKMIQEMKDRNNLLTAEIKSAGYGAMQDMNANKESDFVDAMDRVKSTQEYQQTMAFNQSKESSKTDIANKKLDLEQQKVDIARRASEIPLQVARENTTASEIKAKKNIRKQ